MSTEDQSGPTKVWEESRGNPLRPFINIALTAFLSGILFYAYKYQVSPNFAYMGLTYREPESSSIVFALLASMAVCLVLPGRISKCSDFILWVMFVGVVVPSIQIPQYSLALPRGESLRLAGVVASATIMIAFGARLSPLGKISGLQERKLPVWHAMIALAIVIYAYLILAVGIKLSFLSFDDVYDVRQDFGLRVSGVPLVGYLLPALYNVMNPALIARGFVKKQRLYIVMGVVGQLVIYMTTGQKHVVLGTAVIVLFGIVLSKKKEIAPSSVILTTALVSIVALSLDAWRGGLAWTSLVVRRFLLIPGALTAGYVQTFQDQPREWFAQYIPGQVSSFTESPATLVGAQFIGNSATNANASLFGHGYFHGGYIGIFVEAALLVILLWFADAVSEDLDVRVIAILFFMPSIALTNGNPLTAVMTNGMGAAIALLWLLPQDAFSRTD